MGEFSIFWLSFQASISQSIEIQQKTTAVNLIPAFSMILLCFCRAIRAGKRWKEIFNSAATNERHRILNAINRGKNQRQIQ